MAHAQPMEMKRESKFWELAVGIIGLLAMGIAAWTNINNQVADIKSSIDERDRKYDERYIEQRDQNRNIINGINDLKTQMYEQRILIENKQNRR